MTALTPLAVIPAPDFVGSVVTTFSSGFSYRVFPTTHYAFLVVFLAVLADAFKALTVTEPLPGLLVLFFLALFI